MNKSGPVTKSLELPSLLDMSSVKRIGIGISVTLFIAWWKNFLTQWKN